MNYEIKYQSAAQDYERAAFGLKSNQLEEYVNRILQRYIWLVENNSGANCNDMADLLDKVGVQLHLKTLMIGHCLTGCKNNQFAHMAGIVVDVATQRPVLVLDAIGMAWGGQKNVEPGSYYRWPPSEWCSQKSAHYGGDAGVAVWWRPGTYERPGTGKNMARGIPFHWEIPPGADLIVLALVGFREFSNQRGVVVRGEGDHIDAFYAPYTKASTLVKEALGAL